MGRWIKRWMLGWMDKKWVGDVSEDIKICDRRVAGKCVCCFFISFFKGMLKE